MLTDLAGTVAAWCVQETAASRRPYGIDQLALAVVCATLDGAPIASASFGVFRPEEFYRSGGTRERIEEFVRTVSTQDLDRAWPHAHMAAALFSWGDLARATIYRD